MVANVLEGFFAGQGFKGFALVDDCCMIMMGVGLDRLTGNIGAVLT